VIVDRRIDRAVFGVVFLLVFVFSYSEEIVTGFFEAIGREEHALWRVAVVGFDVLVLGVTGLLKRSIARSDGGEPRLWRWWWSAVSLVLAGDVVLLAAGEDASVWLDIAASTLFIIAMAIIMMSSLNADPLTLFSSAKRAAQPTDWLRARAVVPLVIGTYAAYVGATVWTDYFNIDVVRTLDDELAAEVEQLSLFERELVLREICDPAVDPAYFEQVAQIIPLLLITLGIEFGFFRATLREPAQRAATAATVALMSIGLVFALSTLPWGGDECGEILEAWHEYLTFVVSLQAIFTGVATLVWLLVVTVPDEGETDAES
jgi:hypothetical protein